MSAVIEIDYFNTFIVKGSYSGAATNAGNTVFLSPGIAYPGGINTSDNTGIYIEESRIKGDFNGVSYGAGVKAFLDDPRPLQQKRINTLIYSGIYNSRTGVNDTNVFSTGTDITRSCDPANGSIQKTYAEDTNLIVFQENKVSRALIDKDTIYTTEGGTQTQAGAKVIGQIVPYKGEYGISKNPESFAVYSYRKYFFASDLDCSIVISRDFTVPDLDGVSDHEYLDDNGEPIFDQDFYDEIYNDLLNNNILNNEIFNNIMIRNEINDYPTTILHSSILNDITNQVNLLSIT